MKKINICIIIILLFSGQASKAETSKTIDTIVDIALTEGLYLEEWQVVMKQKISAKQFEHILNKTKNSYFVTTKKDYHKILYIFEAKNRDERINYEFQAIVPHHHADLITFQIVYSGVKWDDSTHFNYIILTNNIQSELLIDFDKIFTCVKLRNNGIIDVGFLIENIWEKMKILHMFDQEDNVKQSVYEKEFYGYTPLWSNNIKVNDEEINFHMIIKNDEENKKQVIIGTPIIMNEY